MEDKIYKHLISKGVSSQLALNIVSQAAFESGNWTSSLYKRAFNMFGYGYINGGKWQSGKTHSGDPHGPENYAKYSNWENSVNEIIDYLDRRKKEGDFSSLSDIEDPVKYVRLLKSNGYFQANEAEYLRGLKSYNAKFKHLTGNTTPDTKPLCIVCPNCNAIFDLRT